MNIQISQVLKVKEEESCFFITKDDGWSFWLDKKYDIIPQIGQEVKILSHWGNQIHGIELDGQIVFWESEEEANQKHKAWVQNTRKKNTNAYKLLMNTIKDEDSFQTIDISGMGGGYERACQIMLKAGIQYLENKPNFIWDYDEYENVYGICCSDSEHAKKLDKVLLDAVNDCTGAMHQAVISHLRFIHQNGYETWLKNYGENRQYIYPKGLPEPSFGRD